MYIYIYIYIYLYIFPLFIFEYISFIIMQVFLIIADVRHVTRVQIDQIKK